MAEPSLRPKELFVIRIRQARGACACIGVAPAIDTTEEGNRGGIRGGWWWWLLLLLLLLLLRGGVAGLAVRIRTPINTPIVSTSIPTAAVTTTTATATATPARTGRAVPRRSVSRCGGRIVLVAVVLGRLVCRDGIGLRHVPSNTRAIRAGAGCIWACCAVGGGGGSGSGGSGRHRRGGGEVLGGSIAGNLVFQGCVRSAWGKK